MRDDEDTNGELVYEQGAGWWVGLRQIRQNTAFKLLHLCLIHRESTYRSDFEVYTLNEEGRKIIDDTNYKPLILSELEKEYKKYGNKIH